MGVTIDSKLKDILADPRARAILEEARPGFASNPMLKLASRMQLSALLRYPQAGFTANEVATITERINALDAAPAGTGAPAPLAVASAPVPDGLDFASVAGKVVIVTGASRGIGESIARVFAAHGMKVVCANRNAAKGQGLVDSIVAQGGDAAHFAADCGNAPEVQALVEFAVATYGRLDGIVNNAGIGMGGTPLHEYTVDDFDRIISLNLKGVFAGMKYGAEAILRSKAQSGFIINVASIAGLVPQLGQSLYTSTKFAVAGMTRTAAMEYGPHHITVNAICPGYTLTSMFDIAPEETMDYFVEQIPSGRMGHPDECAYLALFLASELARYISGAVIPVDGALSAGGKNVIMWRHPEILTDGKVTISSEATIAAIMEVPEALPIVEKYLPGFATNEEAKAAYGLTFPVLCQVPMVGISEDSARAFCDELDALGQLLSETA